VRRVVVVDVVENAAPPGSSGRLQVRQAQHAHRQPDLSYLGAAIVTAGAGQDLQDPVGLFPGLAKIGKTD
jgi:hypothetical protein